MKFQWDFSEKFVYNVLLVRSVWRRNPEKQTKVFPVCAFWKIVEIFNLFFIKADQYCISKNYDTKMRLYWHFSCKIHAMIFSIYNCGYSCAKFIKSL